MFLQGRTNNLMHQAIAELCQSLFYGPLKLASQFPGTFEHEVPVGAVVLVATVVRSRSLFIYVFILYCNRSGAAWRRTKAGIGTTSTSSVPRSTRQYMMHCGGWLIGCRETSTTGISSVLPANHGHRMQGKQHNLSRCTLCSRIQYRLRLGKKCDQSFDMDIILD